MSRTALLFPLVLSVVAMAPAHAENAATVNCPNSINDRSAVIDSLHALGSRLAMGRICAMNEDVLLQLKHQTLSRYAGCLLTYQIKATEIQDALEAPRLEAHTVWKQAKDKSLLCKQVRLATN
ncbi:hypothetical protein HPT27_02795 [Permianibacter sp. IMCC34836]|uniref:hypothetical protein n=1 Tax=Permianibacter fluminis TaxID=2738515 RepID=UPI001555E620|nr:hypothetical protein [Permianibacter fluminis]NQD35934.1 hypothetical protein [Permianibacter fluminis]